MTIILKNKYSLQIEDFFFKCCVGKNGISMKKKEGDNKTPKGIFGIEHLYYRKDRLKKPPETKLKCIEIKNNMGWCNDPKSPKNYNKLIKINKKIRHEVLKRNDYKYNLFVPIKYNYKNPKAGRGSCIFLHLTKNYKPTAGCIGLKEKDFRIVLKLLKNNSKIIIN
ncbi:L,D-transpeptidase family protein [Candidatus Pelagibacter sp. HIMB1715]|uniref:L,D-transpeptidase family protein n=1 Tax=Candidatus Pelagibacter sp. HIMB1715 TaxID=3413369 RepID=UPI003F85C690